MESDNHISKKEKLLAVSFFAVILGGVFGIFHFLRFLLSQFTPKFFILRPQAKTFKPVLVTFLTSFSLGSGTRIKVKLQIVGSDGEAFMFDFGSTVTNFSTGSSTTFLVFFPEIFSGIQAIRLILNPLHNSNGCWKLQQIRIYDLLES